MVAEGERENTGKTVRSKNQENFESVPMMSPNTENTVQTQIPKKQIKGGVNILTHTVLETPQIPLAQHSEKAPHQTKHSTEGVPETTADMRGMHIGTVTRKKLEELKACLGYMEADYAEHGEQG